MTNIDELLSLLKEKHEAEDLFSSKEGGTETNGRFYHVMQKTGLGDNIFNSDNAKYRNNQFRDACKKNSIIILFSVVMGNHTHDLVMVNSLENLSHMYQTLNTATARYIRKQSPKRFKIPGVKVFGQRPMMKAVKSLDHLFYLPYYLRENARECEQQGKSAPYSCFEMYNQGYCNSPYNKEVFEKIFGIDFETYLKALELPKQEFLDYEKRILTKIPKGIENRILKIDPTKEWKSQKK